MQRVEVVHDTELEKDFPRCWPHRVTVTMRGGQTHTLLSEYPPGRITPIAASAVDSKFLSQCVPYLGETGARNALDLLRSVDSVTDMRKFAEALVC